MIEYYSTINEGVPLTGRVVHQLNGERAVPDRLRVKRFQRKAATDSVVVRLGQTIEGASSRGRAPPPPPHRNRPCRACQPCHALFQGLVVEWTGVVWIRSAGRGKRESRHRPRALCHPPPPPRRLTPLLLASLDQRPPTKLPEDSWSTGRPRRARRHLCRSRAVDTCAEANTHTCGQLPPRRNPTWTC